MSVSKTGMSPCLAIRVTELSPAKKSLPGSVYYRTVNVPYFGKVSCAFGFVYF